MVARGVKSQVSISTTESMAVDGSVSHSCGGNRPG